VALEIASPLPVTFAEDCTAQPSRKGSVRAGLGWTSGWAKATAIKKNGSRSRNFFMELSSVLLKDTENDEKLSNDDACE